MNTLYQLNQVVIHLIQLVVLTQKHVISKEKYWWIEMFEMNDIMVKKAQDKQKVKATICWMFRKALPNFWILVFAYILFVIHLGMIKCSYDVIDLFIVVIHNVQYVVTTYGSKINWISIFANHKWVARVLNALIFMFLGILFFYKSAALLICFSNLIYMYFH